MTATPAGEPTTFAHEPGTGQSGPASTKASNIDGSDSRSAIAPHLPAPRGGNNAGPWNYLRDADRALGAHKTGEAQQALEMAETRLLDRSTPANAANQPDQGPVVQQVSQARQALGHGDISGARAAIRTALQSAPGGGMAPVSGAARGPGMQDGTEDRMEFGGQGGMASSSMPGMGGAPAVNSPGGAPNGNGTPTSAMMAPSGAGPAPGASAGARVGGGPAGTGTTDSAGGAK